MLSSNIRFLREFLKLTRKEFGEKLGVSGDVVNNWERGRVAIGDIAIKSICSTYHIRESWLRTGEGEMEEKDLFEDLVSAYDLGPAGQALMHAIARLFRVLGEDACNKVIEDLLAELQTGIANRQAASVTFPQAPAEEDEESSASSSGSVVG